MVSQRLKKHANELVYLQKARPCIRNHLITKADRSLVDCLCECADNILRGNVPLTKLQKEKLKRNKAEKVGLSQGWETFGEVLREANVPQDLIGHEELFTVVKCIETSPLVYLVKDDHGEILEGTFYAEELQKVIKTDDVYKIEPILKKRKKG